jgi:hypothetical protein
MTINAVEGNKKGLHRPGPFRTNGLQPLGLLIRDGSKALPYPARKGGKYDTFFFLTRSGLPPSSTPFGINRAEAAKGSNPVIKTAEKACNLRLEQEIPPLCSISVDILRQWRYM